MPPTYVHGAGAAVAFLVPSGKAATWNASRFTRGVVSAPWVDAEGDTCRDYARKRYCTRAGAVGGGWQEWWGPLSDYSVDGVDALGVCYACGAGYAGPHFSADRLRVDSAYVPTNSEDFAVETVRRVALSRLLTRDTPDRFEGAGHAFTSVFAAGDRLAVQPGADDVAAAEREH